eukprot:TRINITY_DN6992_c0_g1_i1.p1 TRINITY_DN6992_c0_g1~~TRINITY_DN6992_c0_g1_i1.p1  ORF type:complete len:586 (+),score=119.53 TRINITY_DN6992_c0_g1_i1:69-1760(+)
MDALERLDLLREEVLDAQKKFDRSYHDLCDKTALLLFESTRVAQHLRAVGSRPSEASRQSLTSAGGSDDATSQVLSGGTSSLGPPGLRSCLRAHDDPQRHVVPSHPSTCLSPRQMRIQRCDELRRAYEQGISPVIFIGTAGLQIDDDVQHGYLIIAGDRSALETLEFSNYARETITKKQAGELAVVDACSRLGVVELAFTDGTRWTVVNHNDTKSSSTLRLLDLLGEHITVRHHEAWPQTLPPCVRNYAERERAFQAQFAYEDRKASVNERMNINSPLRTSLIKEPESPIDQALGMVPIHGSTPRPAVSPLTIPSVVTASGDALERERLVHMSASVPKAAVEKADVSNPAESPSHERVTGLTRLKTRSHPVIASEQSSTPSPTRAVEAQAEESDKAVLSPSSLQLLATSRVSPTGATRFSRISSPNIFPQPAPGASRARVVSSPTGQAIRPAALNPNKKPGLGRVSTNSKFIRLDDTRREHTDDRSEASSSDAQRPVLQKPDSKGSLFDGSVGSAELDFMPDSVPTSPGNVGSMEHNMYKNTLMRLREIKDRSASVSAPAAFS